jgi:moderate conductance mechanosensitive channel
VKPVALIVHLFLLTIVLQCRWSVAARIRDPGEAGSSLALLHNWLARVWHYIAIFLHHRVMGSLGVRVRNGYSGLLRFASSRSSW